MVGQWYLKFLRVESETLLGKRFRAMVTSTMVRINKRAFAVGTFLCLLAVVLTVSLLPPPDKIRLHSKGRLHDAGHMLAFAALAFVAAKISTVFRKRFQASMGLLALSFAIEGIEHLIWLSPFEWRDVFTDAIGIIGGLLLALLPGMMQTLRRNPST